MKETIRCCIACILPCGSLDVIRIVHSNGHVEEISGTITASDIMKAYPKHVLKKPSSPPSDHEERDVISATRIVIVPPEAELRRGKIYFLMPAATKSTVGKTRRDKSNANVNANAVKRRSLDRRNREDGNDKSSKENNEEKDLTPLISDRYLTEILSEKIATQRDRRKGRVGVWRPHLESISESLSED